MSRYDVMQVCLNGHRITDSYHSHPEFRKDYCDQCGEKTITECPDCGAPIKGELISKNVIWAFPTPVPNNCHNCGSPYPWTQKNATTPTPDPTGPNSLGIIKKICSRFHLVVRQLQQRYDNRETLTVNDEYDVQDLFHALLRIYFEDIRPEEWTPSYAGGCSRIDFLLLDEEITIEIKKTREGLTAKKLGSQLIEDTAKYQKHPTCKTLICFVYDPEGRINNPRGIENDLSGKKDNIEVKVYIVPKGI